MKPRLHSHGAARIAAGFTELDPSLPPPLPDTVREALRRSEVGEEDAHLAWELARLTGARAEEHLARTAILIATQDALSRGSTRVAVEHLGAAIVALGFDPAVAERALAAIGDPALFGPDRPLILQDGHVHQERVHAVEERLIARLRARLGRAEERSIDPSLAAIERHPSSVRLTDEQLAAVRTALSSPFAAISGGPGTGKTSIVVAILRAAVHAGIVAPASIALAAPTGKAADRMRGSIAAALAAIADPLASDRALSANPPSPKTLHRLLGYSDRFAHHERNPLSESLVIVDESSMVDVFLMERLIASLRPSARLVLLGDAEQLPSVAAGAVFRDLLRAAPSVHLTKSHRMDASRPEGANILRVAARINAGELPSFDRAPEAGLPVGDRIGWLDEAPSIERLRGVHLYSPPSPLAREQFLDRWYAWRALDRATLERAWPLVDGRLAPSPRLDAVFVHAERARLLCITRSAARPTGVEAINQALHRRHTDRTGAAAHFAIGEPVVVLKNDYERGLFNGDQGLVLLCASEDEPPRAHAVFRADTGFAAHPLDAVRAILDLGYATTVHKAQGSEHDDVALVLPESDSPRLLSREIVYTAITRARRSVVLIGAPDLLARAAQRRIERSTSIAERLAAPGR